MYTIVLDSPVMQAQAGNCEIEVFMAADSQPYITTIDAVRQGDRSCYQAFLLDSDGTRVCRCDTNPI